MTRLDRDMIFRGVRIFVIGLVIVLIGLVLFQWFIRGSFSSNNPIGGLDQERVDKFSAEAVPEFEYSNCPFDPPDGIQMSCGTVFVPRNRSDAQDQNVVSLAVIIYHSTNPEPAKDPIVFLDGGPGGLTIDTLPFMFNDSILPWLSERAFITFDQRGIGRSQPSVECSEVIRLNEDFTYLQRDPEQYQERYLEELENCRERLISEGVDLAGYSSAESAADVEAIRLSLNVEQWNLYGVSYGTRLAQTIMRDYPDGVRSVILDSAYPIEADLFENFPLSLSRSFENFFVYCAADAVCQTDYPNLEKRFYALVQELNATPVEVESDYVINGDDLIWMLSQALYSENLFIHMPDIIDDLENGEIEDAVSMNELLFTGNSYFNDNIYRTIQCREEYVFSDLEKTQAAIKYNPHLHRYFEDYLFAIDECQVWQAGTADPIENEPVVSNIPTLIFAGGFDPITPPEWGDSLQKNLNQSTYALIPQLAHGTLNASGCTFQIGVDFVEKPTAQLDLGCIDDFPEPVFRSPD